MDPMVPRWVRRGAPSSSHLPVHKQINSKTIYLKLLKDRSEFGRGKLSQAIVVGSNGGVADS